MKLTKSQEHEIDMKVFTGNVAVHCFTSKRKIYRYFIQSQHVVCLFYCHLKTPVTSLSICMCHQLTLVICFEVTTIINVVFSGLSSCHRTELNCGNKANRERKRRRNGPFFLSLSLVLFLFLLCSMKRKDEHKSASALALYEKEE